MKFWPTQCEQTWVFSSPALQIYAFWVSSVFLFPSDWQSERWMDAEIKSTYRRWQSFCQSWNVYLRTATWEKTESSWFKLLCLWISVLQKLFINQYQQNRENCCKETLSFHMHCSYSESSHMIRNFGCQSNALATKNTVFLQWSSSLKNASILSVNTH